jgi:hypothetical protein
MISMLIAPSVGSGIAPFFPVSSGGGNAPWLFPWRVVCEDHHLILRNMTESSTNTFAVPLLPSHTLPDLRRFHLVCLHPMDHSRNSYAQSKPLVHHRNSGHLVG